MNSIKVSNDTIVQEIKIKALAHRIFAALTNPDELLRWWGAKGKFKAADIECDLRPGVKWRMRVRGSGGTESTVAGEYREIVPPGLLVFTWIREQEMVSKRWCAGILRNTIASPQFA